MNFDKLHAPLKYILLVLAVAHLALATVGVWYCIGYPYDFDWIEGGMLSEVIHVYSGGPLYSAPSIDFIPMMYPPLYVYVSAALSHLTGVGMFSLRLVSLVCVLGTMLLAYSFVLRETGRHWAALVASALFAAGFHYASGELNLARVDYLFLLLITGSAYVVRFYERPGMLAAAGALATLAFLTKQTALFVFLPLSVFAAAYYRKKSLYFILTAVLLSLASNLLLDIRYGGWYNYYVFKIPSGHSMVWSMVAGFWLDEMLPFAVALAGTVYYIYTLCAAGDRKRAVYYAMFFFGMVGGAWVSRVNEGSSWNVLLPAYACIAIIFAQGMAAAVSSPGRLRGAGATALCAAQLIYLLYNPMDRVPAAADMEAGAAMTARISEVEGDVFLPFTNYLAYEAGKKMFAHNMAIDDVLEHDMDGSGRVLLEELKSALEQKRFAAVIVFPGGLYPDVEREIIGNYLVTQEIVFPGARYWANGTTMQGMYYCVREQR